MAGRVLEMLQQSMYPSAFKSKLEQLLGKKIVYI